MLNVVNFGGGAYVIYAEVLPTGEIEVDPEPYSDTFDRPARLLPIEAKALVAAIDLIGLAHAGPALGARRRSSTRSGFDPVEEGLHIVSPDGRGRRSRHTVELAVHETPAARDRVLDADRGPLLRARRRALRADQRPRGLVRRRLGPRRAGDLRHFRLDRIKRADGARRALRAARGPEPGRRHRRLAAHRHGRRLARRAGADLAPSRRAGRASSAPCWPSSTTARIIVEITFKGIDSWCARCSRRRATPSCSSPPTPARRCWPPPRACSPAPREPPRARSR